MSKLTLVSKISEELGVSTAKAAKLVDDLGADLADDLATTADESTIVGSKWWKRGAVGGTAGGAGLLAWRQQDIARLKAETANRQSSLEAAKMLAELDLGADKKRSLAAALLGQAANPGGGGGGGGDGGGGGLLGGDIQTTLVLLVVVAFALRYTLGDDD